MGDWKLFPFAMSVLLFALGGFAVLVGCFGTSPYSPPPLAFICMGAGMMLVAVLFMIDLARRE